jgi:hypothetical protein
MNTTKNLTKLFLATLLIFSASFNLDSAILTVTNSNDAGTGSLRQTVLDANSGDTIIFGIVRFIVID